MTVDTINMLSPSPFLKEGEKPRVCVARDDDDASATREALDAFGIGAASGLRVLLKPNAGRMAEPGSGITTSPAVVAAAIDAFRAAGATVAVGESPITGVKSLEALEATGIAAVAHERECPLIDLDARPCVDIPLPGGRAIDTIKVCADVLEHDLVVSIPVMKIHMHTGVTLAVKNMKGCLWRRSKVELHMLPETGDPDIKPLDTAIADMASFLRPHLSIIDGSVGMEGMGPSAGEAKKLGVVVVGADPFAADAVACRLMGRSAEEIPHLRIGAERGLGKIDLSAIDVEPGDWERHAEAFAAPPRDLEMEFPDVNILDKQSCSGCQSTLLLFLQNHLDELKEYMPDGERINIAIGKGHETLPEGTLCIGNCTRLHRDTGTFVPGCPPVGSNILRAIKEKS